MANQSLHLLVIEVSVGMVTIILAFLTVALLRYAWHGRGGNGDKSAARNAAIGLALIFGPLALRGAGAWFLLWRNSMRLPVPQVVETWASTAQMVTTIIVAIGAIVCLREFYVATTTWFIILVAALLIPLASVFIYLV